LERAALSISNNIAEGFERTTNELLAFVYIARGSGRRGSLDDAGIEDVGHLQGLQISDFKFHVPLRKDLKTTLRLDRKFEKFRNTRPAPIGRQGKESLREQTRAGRVPGRAKPPHRQAARKIIVLSPEFFPYAFCWNLKSAISAI
jgi:hypothetical protein